MIFGSLKPDYAGSFWTWLYFPLMSLPSLCSVFDLSFSPFPMFVLVLCLYSLGPYHVRSEGAATIKIVLPHLFFLLVPFLTPGLC